jgi:hypothetical protein
MGEWKYSSTILDLGVRWRWVASFTALPCYPWETAPGTHWTGGWMGPRAGVDIMEKRRVSFPYWESDSGSLVVQTSAKLFTDWAVQAAPCIILSVVYYRHCQDHTHFKWKLFFIIFICCLNICSFFLHFFVLLLSHSSIILQFSTTTTFPTSSSAVSLVQRHDTHSCASRVWRSYSIE